MFELIENARQRAFLSAFSLKGQVIPAAELAGIARETHYAWLRNDSEYAEAFAIAREMAADALEDKAMEQAFDGSETLLKFLLGALRPAKYGKKVEHSGPGGAPVEITVKFV